MSRLSPLVVLAVLCVFPLASHARKSPLPVADTPDKAAARGGNESPGPGVVGAGVLQLWTFDNPNGTPNAQGWTSVDRTAHPALFHVVTAPPTLPPGFSGKALWLGVNASNCASMDACGYASLPGYGNGWQQRWQTQTFNVTTLGITVNFQLSYDMEPSYDFLYLEYTNGGNIWNPMGSWTGTGTEAVSKSLAGGTYTSPIRFRIRFESDGGFSDEDGQFNSIDGPVYIDNLSIVNNGVTIDSQNFTAEALNATNTVDDHWIAIAPTAFGNYAALFGGPAVVQQDPVIYNPTNMWGFFNGSPENYACGGYPAQAVVKHGSTSGNIKSYIVNEIQSPIVSLTGVGATEPVLLTFDAYMDLPASAVVVYEFRVRSKVGGVWQRWRVGGPTWYNPAKEWLARSHDLRPRIATGATDIQIGLGVHDLCPTLCGIGPFGDGSCHSHGPLFDNISVTVPNTLPGPNVYVTPVDVTTGTSPVLIQFYNVTEPGLTTLVTSPTGPPVPGSFLVGNSTYYNVSTTATINDFFEISFQYNQATLTVPEADLRVLHWDTQLDPDAWVDITYFVDTVNNRAFGLTDHLSPFVIGAGSVTAVGDAPARPALHQNVPNPFNPTTTITYDVPTGGRDISLKVYDATGRLVRSLVDGQKPAGSHHVTWDGRDAFGTSVASGVYFYKLTAGSFVESRRMVLLK